VIVANGAGLYRREQVIVRSMMLNERAVWEKLWNDYLGFYETELSDEVKNVTWARLHDPNEPMYLLAGCLGGHVVGIVHYLFHCSCWTLGNYCYLQDLFVDAQARGLGVGATLIKTVESAARAAGASRLYWLTKEDNRTARALYDKLAERSGFIQYRKLF
jgi:GNAT superfamily N-acetyltransferase